MAITTKQKATLLLGFFCVVALIWFTTNGSAHWRIEDDAGAFVTRGRIASGTILEVEVREVGAGGGLDLHLVLPAKGYEWITNGVSMKPIRSGAKLELEASLFPKAFPDVAFLISCVNAEDKSAGEAIAEGNPIKKPVSATDLDGTTILQFGRGTILAVRLK